MAPVTIDLPRIANPLVSSQQLLEYRASFLSDEKASSAIFTLSLLTQSAGILLRLPQEIIATSLVILQRYLVVTASEPKFQCHGEEASATAIYLCAKQSFYPLAPRSVINVYAYLASKASPLGTVIRDKSSTQPNPTDYFVSEGTYERRRQALFDCEKKLLAAIGFDTKVVLPYSLALTYLQALGASNTESAERIFEHLNGALLSPQLLYLTHQPNALAVAAIYLAARETGVKLVDENWWEVFDVDREDLGFLVLAYGSLEGFAKAEKEKWREMPEGTNVEL